ncbi:MAG TPA: hypothetical protein VGM39_08115 [Kofleriaceae bacterium]|jgi:hypothetical protein
MGTRAALVVLAALATTAHAEPSDKRLFWTGVALAPPTYMIGVTLHEGSHALMGKILGAEITEMHLFPPGVDPHVDKFRFGWVYARGLTTTADRQWFLIAPKITDTALLGGFAALAFTDAWPTNRYGRLALTVFATGLWIDFSKDVLAFSKQNDVVKVFHNWCFTGWRQIPARAVYTVAIVGLGYVVWHGYTRTFHTLEDDPGTTARTISLPVWTTAF